MKFTNFQLVIGFLNDQNLILNNGHRISATGKLIGGTIHQTNIPEGSPPEAPRSIIRSKDLLINIANNRFELISFSPSHIQADTEEYLNYNIEKILPVLESLLSENVIYQWTGIVVRVEYPGLKNKSAIQNCEPIFDRLVNIARNSQPLSTFQLQYGITKNNRNIAYSISGYEQRSLNFKEPLIIPPGESITFDLSNSTIVESGISIVIDINNRNQKADSPIQDFKNIARDSKFYLANIPDDLNMKGLL